MQKPKPQEAGKILSEFKGVLAVCGTMKPKAEMSMRPFCYLTTLMGKLRPILSEAVTKIDQREVTHS